MVAHLAGTGGLQADTVDVVPGDGDTGVTTPRGTPWMCPPGRHAGGGAGSTTTPMGRCGVLGWAMSITGAGPAMTEPPPEEPHGRFWGAPGVTPQQRGLGGVLGAHPSGAGGFGVPRFRPLPDEEGPVDLEDALDVEALGAPTLGASWSARPVAHEDGVVLHIWGRTGHMGGSHTARAPPPTPVPPESRGDCPHPALPMGAPSRLHPKAPQNPIPLLSHVPTLCINAAP